MWNYKLTLKFRAKIKEYFVTYDISMCNQMVTSEIREEFHARFGQILIISRAFRRRKLLGFGQNASEIIP